MKKHAHDPTMSDNRKVQGSASIGTSIAIGRGTPAGLVAGALCARSSASSFRSARTTAS